jgi:hypothetical protein
MLGENQFAVAITTDNWSWMQSQFNLHWIQIAALILFVFMMGAKVGNLYAAMMEGNQEPEWRVIDEDEPLDPLPNKSYICGEHKWWLSDEQLQADAKQNRNDMTESGLSTRPSFFTSVITKDKHLAGALKMRCHVCNMIRGLRYTGSNQCKRKGKCDTCGETLFTVAVNGNEKKAVVKSELF